MPSEHAGSLRHILTNERAGVREAPRDMFLFGRTRQHEGSVKAIVKEVEEFKVLNLEHIAS